MMKNPLFSKTIGWIILAGLVLLDVSLDLIFAQGKGLESPVWRPIAQLFGVHNPLFFTPLILIIFYFVVKGGSWLTEKYDHIYVKTEELVLTTLVIIYGFFDLWLLLVYFFNFRLISNQFYLIPFLITIGIIYSWWAEKKLKNKRSK